MSSAELQWMLFWRMDSWRHVSMKLPKRQKNSPWWFQISLKMRKRLSRWHSDRRQNHRCCYSRAHWECWGSFGGCYSCSPSSRSYSIPKRTCSGCGTQNCQTLEYYWSCQHPICCQRCRRHMQWMHVQASPSFPFVSKTNGVDLLKLQQSNGSSRYIRHNLLTLETRNCPSSFVGVKAPMFSFTRLCG